VLVDLLGREVDFLCKDRRDILANDEKKLVGNGVEVVGCLHELLYSSDREETLVASCIGALRVEDRWANDGGEIRDVHPTASLLVAVRKGCDPFEKDEEDFQSIPVAPW
jgi:hypothetical protein